VGYRGAAGMGDLVAITAEAAGLSVAFQVVRF